MSRAVEYYQFGGEFYEKRQDLIKLAYLFANVGGKINRAIGRSSEAEKVLTRCLKILENEKHEKLGVARAKLQLGNLYRLYGRWDEALQKCQDSVSLYKEIGNDYCAGTALFTLGRIKMQKGDLHSAELTCQESIKLLKKWMQHTGMVWQFATWGTFYFCKVGYQRRKRSITNVSFFLRKLAPI